MGSLDGNEDYQLLLSALNVLKNQLEQAELDVARLTQLKDQALGDPTAFLNDILSKSGPKEHIPKLQRVVAIPEIDFSKYGIGPSPTPAARGLLRKSRSSTVFKSQNYNVFPALERFPSHMTTLGNSTDSLFEDPPQPLFPTSLHTQGPPQKKAALIPTRVASATQEPVTIPTQPPQLATKSVPAIAATLPTPTAPAKQYNSAAWSDAENRKLLELLDVYPPEETISARAAKISHAMGTRSPIQVANRLNKLIGSDARSSMRAKLGLQQRLANSSRKTSGAQYLGTATSVVQMSDDSDSDLGMDVDPAIKKTEEYKELIRLKRLEKIKQKEHAANSAPIGPIHRNYSCDSCQITPIVGTRWKCLVCPISSQVDLCNDCHTKRFENSMHKADHAFDEIEFPEVSMDDDQNLGSAQ